MTRDEIIRMAREAGINVEQGFLLRFADVEDDLERFARAAYEAGAAAEREGCKDVCTPYVNSTNDAVALTALNILDAIRARGEK